MGHEYLSEVPGCNGRYRRKGILDVNRIFREARLTDMAESDLSRNVNTEPKKSYR